MPYRALKKATTAGQKRPPMRGSIFGKPSRSSWRTIPRQRFSDCDNRRAISASQGKRPWRLRVGGSAELSRITRGPAARAMAQSRHPKFRDDWRQFGSFRNPTRQPTFHPDGRDWNGGRSDCRAISPNDHHVISACQTKIMVKSPVFSVTVTSLRSYNTRHFLHDHCQDSHV